MSKLIKRKDGSYSKRGLWDNIRANKGSGKKPTKEMLKQESKIKKEENMKSMYKKGGKKMKGESFMEESKEIDFQAPGVKPPMKYMMGGLETGMQANARQNQAEGKATMAGKKKVYKTGGAKTMEPGGGGRFAAMVGKLKSKGKSEESAEAIAASAGRKKYGKSKFQAMAAAGKKKMMGGKKC